MHLPKTFYTVLIYTLGLFLFVQSLAVASSLEEALDRHFRSNNGNTEWSVKVEEAESRKELYSLSPNRSLIPASNIKIPVAAAILLELGPDYTYETKLYITGSVADGVLTGDLLIVGSGDPSIGGRFHNGDVTHTFREWAGILKNRNISSIRGNVIGVDDFFDDNRHGLNWNPIDYVEWYAAEVSGLTFNDGCIDLRVTGASSPTQKATITLNPPTRYMKITNNINTVNSANRERILTLDRRTDSTDLTVSGAIRQKHSSMIYASVPNPTLFFATVLKETFEKEGIAVSGKPMDADDVKNFPPSTFWTLIHTHTSPPLRQLIDVCVKHSQNLYAEHFLKTLGFHVYSKGSFEAGILAIKDVLFKHGCSLDSHYLADGSGLSRENSLSAQGFVDILQTMHQSKYQHIFRDSLPIAGVDGTLRHRLRDQSTIKKVRAKTGSMKGISALSGQLQTVSGKTCYFSIIGNSPHNHTRLSTAIDKACTIISTEG
jgi:serine-type D-Ala-D-Ala carboxypeptidase/endopeptidase (penicillin-binding protein 4)